MTRDALIDAIRLAYPQIWFACHVEHRTRHHAGGLGLTDRDAGVLAHIAVERGEALTASALARHLGIGKPALSQHLKRLQTQGLVEQHPAARDARQRVLQLTPLGRERLSDASPLDGERLAQLLDLIPREQRQAAVNGLQCLADAACRLRQRNDTGRHA